MKVAVVILNWNGRGLLETFLPSVVQYSPEATIYVADNASTDTSLEFVRSNFPTVKIIQNKINGGYAKGYNDALRGLSEEIFVLLNSDVEVTKNWLPPILAAFEANPKLAAAQPKILDHKNKKYFEYAGAAGGFIDKFGYPYCRGRIFNTIEMDNGQYDDSISIFWASGACLCVKNQIYWAAGGFDEDYFAHQEEIDLCWRILLAGGEISYIGGSVVYHKGGSTLPSANPKKTFFNFRNSLFNIAKNVAGTRALYIIFIRMVLDAGAAFQFLFQGKVSHFVAVIKAHFSFYRMLPKFIAKRTKSSSKLKYYSAQSIVYQYFIKGKRTFKEL